MIEVMKNIVRFLVFIVFISCNNNDDSDKNINAFKEPIRKIIFTVDEFSDTYKLFLDKEGKIKKNIGIIVGKHKFLLDEIKENMTLSKVEKNTSFLCLTTKGTSTGEAPGFQILTYALYENGEPFYITIDNKKKFEIIVTKEPKKGLEEVLVSTDITVNGKETKFIFDGFQPYIILK